MASDEVGSYHNFRLERSACSRFPGVLVAVVVSAADQPAVKTPTEALAKVQELDLPTGVTLTGTTEKIDPPVATKESDEDKDSDDKMEQWWGLGGLGLGGWGSWGGWAGLGPYRFGFMYGGYPGWPYPLGYWNAFGAGLYGGGCGLGMPFATTAKLSVSRF